MNDLEINIAISDFVSSTLANIYGTTMQDIKSKHNEEYEKLKKEIRETIKQWEQNDSRKNN